MSPSPASAPRRAAATLEVRAGALATLAPPDAPGGTFVVTDANVAPLLPGALATLPRHVLAPGEEHKTWDELGRLLAALDAAGLDRDGHVLAVGGGVVTDIAGLAASLHRRGVAWTAVPTTLVGQVDAAIGGKTAVDHGGGKNTLGTFHFPARVVVDPRALATLPARHLRAGLGEVLKSALLQGEAALARVERLAPDDFARATPAGVGVIEVCARHKAALVDEDPLDEGRRRLLNLGHTFGHALEAAALPALLHGEAVAAGLLCAARLAAGVRPGTTAGLEARLRAILRRWDLPDRLSLPAAAVEAQLRRDKKRRGGALRCVLPLAPGHAEVIEVQAETVRQALAAVLE
ncbi:MAG TPA: 3-dehydroquinate synthase family protein [Planctomycetota bacterium]|nr:3-dehydroquinate synthase family protein [Planctomycetota bacterium]